MPLPSSEPIPIRISEDVVLVRQAVRKRAIDLGFSLTDQTKVVTASSELARNALDYGGGGSVSLEVVKNGVKVGLKLVFSDSGPGISDVDAALKDGFTTGSGMGLGLGGAKRLSHDFQIESQPGLGTRITIVRWKG